MLDATRSSELPMWFAFFDLEDERERVAMARAIQLALGGDRG